MSLRGLTNHSINFMSLRGLTNHGIDVTDSQRTIYVKACHILMASSLHFKDLLTKRDQYHSQGPSTNKLFHQGSYSNRSKHNKARVVPRFIIRGPKPLIINLISQNIYFQYISLYWSLLGFFGFSHFNTNHYYTNTNNFRPQHITNASI